MPAAVLLRGALTAAVTSCALVAAVSVAWAGRDALAVIRASGPVDSVLAKAYFNQANPGVRLFGVCDMWHRDAIGVYGTVTVGGGKSIRLLVPNVAPGRRSRCRNIEVKAAVGAPVRILVCTQNGRLCARDTSGVA